MIYRSIEKGLFCFFLLIASLPAEIYHQSLSDRCNVCSSYICSRTTKNPFEELFVTWNAQRPKKGYFEIYVSVKDKKWSSWLLYATWGTQGQRGYTTPKEGLARVYQDAVQVLEGKGRAFRVKVDAKEGADLKQFDALHISCHSGENKASKTIGDDLYFAELGVPNISQMALPDERSNRLCSPTSTTAVVQYLKGVEIDPIQFADGVWDEGFDIYGNWVFNVANAYTKLGKDWSCWVERLTGFNDILEYLYDGTPVVISIRGPLRGGAQPYKSGHLLVVKGYDHANKEVLCMDPAFETDEMTSVRYDLNDLINAWERRGLIAYLFKRK